MSFSRLLVLVFGCASLGAVAAPETFTIEPGHSFARFGYTHLGYSTQISRFNKTSGTIVVDFEAGTGSVDVSIDTTSVDTGSAVFDKHIQGEDFLNTATYPKATYKSSRLVFEGGKLARVEGELNVKGVTHPVTLTVTHFFCKPHPVLKKDACGADATAMIKRSDFNMGKSVPHVGDEVTLSIAVEALKP